jgi:hypothetical protein
VCVAPNVNILRASRGHSLNVKVNTDNWKNRLVLVFCESCSRDNSGNLLMRDVLPFPSATRTTCRKGDR